MYKVISHQIKEEHFEAPAAAAHGIATYCGGGYQGNVAPPTGSQFNYWYRMVDRLDEDPATNSWEGDVGQIAVGPMFAYLCVEDDTWIRWSITKQW